MNASQLLADLKAATVLDRAESLLVCGDFDSAAGEAWLATQERPYDERGWSLLARAHYHAGRQRDALQTCRAVRALLVDELGIDPSPGLAELEIRILNQDLEPPSQTSTEEVAGQSAPFSIPAMPDPFIGRDALVDEVTGQLDAARVVSLVGLGGIGKTTVARAVAHRVAEAGRPVHISELETETVSQAAIERVCRDAGVDADDPVGALAGLGEGTLLVLDNVEQIDGFGAVLARCLAGSRASVLTTSRTPLRLREERVIRVGALPVGGADGELSPAAALFLEFAARARPGLDRQAAAASGERVGELLDGIPLALELMAMRTRILTVSQIAGRIERGVTSSLSGSRRVDQPDRQLSLGAVVAQTVEGLTGPPRALLPWLASLEGWTSIELLDSVATEAIGVDLVDALEDLADSGLIDLSANGLVRLRMPIRDYLAGLEDGAAANRRVIGEVRRLVTDIAPTLLGSETSSGLDRIARDHDPVTGALAVAVSEGLAGDATAIVLAMNRYWLLTGRIVEGRRWIESVSKMPGLTDTDRTRVAILAGTFASYQNDASAAAALESALVTADTLGVPVDRLVVNGWCCLAALQAQRGEHDESRRLSGIAGRVADSSGDAGLQGLARDVRGFVAAYASDYDVAVECHLACLADARRTGDAHTVINLAIALTDDYMGLGRFGDALEMSSLAFELVGRSSGSSLVGAVLKVQGMTHIAVGRVAESRGFLTEALRLAHHNGVDPVTEGDALILLSAGAALERSDDLAARLWGAGEAILADLGIAARSRLVPAVMDEITALEGRLAGRFQALATSGSASPTKVVEGVLAERPD